MFRAGIVGSLESASSTHQICTSSKAWHRTLAQKQQGGLIPQAFQNALNKENLRLGDRDFTKGISSCGRAALWQDSCALLEMMEQAKVKHTVFSFSATISACEKGGQWCHALTLLLAMPHSQVDPNVISYNAAISACEKAGQWHVALVLFEEMPRAKVARDVITLLTTRRLAHVKRVDKGTKHWPCFKLCLGQGLIMMSSATMQPSLHAKEMVGRMR